MGDLATMATSATAPKNAQATAIALTEASVAFRLSGGGSYTAVALVAIVARSPMPAAG
jgi:adenine-specific DNA glycosylase